MHLHVHKYMYLHMCMCVCTSVEGCECVYVEDDRLSEVANRAALFKTVPENV